MDVVLLSELVGRRVSIEICDDFDHEGELLAVADGWLKLREDDEIRCYNLRYVKSVSEETAGDVAKPGRKRRFFGKGEKEEKWDGEIGS